MCKWISQAHNHVNHLITVICIQMTNRAFVDITKPILIYLARDTLCKLIMHKHEHKSSHCMLTCVQSELAMPMIMLITWLLLFVYKWTNRATNGHHQPIPLARSSCVNKNTNSFQENVNMGAKWISQAYDHVNHLITAICTQMINRATNGHHQPILSQSKSCNSMHNFI